MQSTGRRTFLATGVLAAAGLLTACTSGSGSGSGSGGKGKADTDRPLRSRAVAATDALLAQYAALPAGGGPVATALQSELVQQRAALAAGLPGGGSPAASGGASPAAPGDASPAGGGTAVTPAAVAAAERTTAQGRLADLQAASPELARLLASVAAAGAVHAVRLGDQTPLTVPGDAPTGAASAAAPSSNAASPNTPSAGSAAAKAPASAAAPAPLSPESVAVLQAALAAEHAAVYAFGVVGAKIPPGPKRDDARACYAVHQARRDGWQRTLAAAGATPAAAAPGYRLPFPVPDANGAAKLAAEVESRLLAVYADLVAGTTGALRMTAATALRECALQCNHWGGSPGALPGTAAATGGTSASPSPH
ncbi:ferritin-like domain-containing protein [Kitasatospora sp. NPDC058965]|uniref:ferritin-like domain-containing protein n=1 Tax=Kitasatospora sp. NPDC058965 TaxID=3346682 RepID=UPI0036C26072